MFMLQYLPFCFFTTARYCSRGLPGKQWKKQRKRRRFFVKDFCTQDLTTAKSFRRSHFIRHQLLRAFPGAGRAEVANRNIFLPCRVDDSVIELMRNRVGLNPNDIRALDDVDVRQHFPVKKSNIGQHRADGLPPGIVATEGHDPALRLIWKRNRGLRLVLRLTFPPSQVE